MTIEELNKLIQEELKAYLNENELDVVGEEMMEDEDDIEVTTDEPEEEGGEAMATLRQIFDMLKPIVEPEEEEPEMEMDDDEGMEDDDEEGDDEAEEMDENMDHPNYRADYVKDVAHNAEKIKGGLNESVDMTARFKKLANIK